MAQKEFASTWKRVLGDVLGELMETKGEVADAMKAADTDATDVIKRFVEELENARKNNRETVLEMDQVRNPDPNSGKVTEDMSQLIHRAGNGLEDLEMQSKALAEEAGRAVDGFFAGTAAQYDVIKRNSDLIEQVRELPEV